MRTKGHNTSAAVGRWLDLVCASGSIIDGDPMVSPHHCIGVAGKSNKVLVGPWWVIPLTERQHWNIHNDLELFRADAFFWNGETRKEIEKKLFSDLVGKVGQGEMPNEVFEAIKGYQR